MKKLKQTYRKLSAGEKRAYNTLHRKLEKERPEIEGWANATLNRLEALDHVVAALRRARIKKRVTLGQVEEASGLGRSVVSRLENDPDPNPTLDTLLELAAAIGVDMRFAVVDRKTGRVLDLKNTQAA